MSSTNKQQVSALFYFSSCELRRTVLTKTRVMLGIILILDSKESSIERKEAKG